MFWVPNKVPVNRTECRCNCFDTVYKGNTFEYSDASASACASADLVGGGVRRVQTLLKNSVFLVSLRPPRKIS